MVARRLLFALLVSALLHAVFFVRTWIQLPTQPVAMAPLEARLAERPVPPPAARPEPPSAPSSPRVARRPPPPPPVVVTPRVADATPFALPARPEPPEPEAPLFGEAAPGEQAAPAPLSAPTASSATKADAPVPPQRLPVAGEITYALFIGTDGFSVGRSTFFWTVEGDAYRLVSDAETTGVVDVFRPQRLNYVSEGRLSADGLRPERFLMSRTRRGTTEHASAHLDWEARQISYGRPGELRTVALPEASQDVVSFILQLALHPPAQGRIQLPITNGTRFEIYELEVLAEEPIETPLGLLVALPLRQVRKQGAESIELWLAVDYRYLPVKLRFRDREGNPSGEQLVSAIRVGQP